VADPSTQHPGGEPAHGTRRRVLVVDDNATNRRVAQSLLARRGVDVAVAESGRRALAWLAEQPCDLVLLDGMMPGLDGPATAREIRRRERAAGCDPVPIVALTASVLPEDRQLMLDAGMNDHVGKPLRTEELVAVLARWLPADGGSRTSVIPGQPSGLTPGTELAEQVAGSSPSIVDLEAFGRLSDLGDATFVERIIRLFLADAAERVAQAEDAIEARDAVRLRAALHALEGICGNVGAAALDRRARDVHEVIHRREAQGERPFARSLGETGLETLLETTRRRYRDLLAEGG
jgi:two-component system, sensor histidine kinase and response regulator